MARLHASAHVSTGTFSSPSPTFLRSFPPKFTTKTNRVLPRVSISVRCALSRPIWRESRRLFSVSFVLSQFLLLPNNAIAASFLDKYVKRKKLEPLEVYVPPVILTQLQIKNLEKTLEVDQPQYSNCRSQLRSGPAASLRVNIRAVAQYASDAGSGKTAFDDVDQCLRYYKIYHHFPATCETPKYFRHVQLSLSGLVILRRLGRITEHKPWKILIPCFCVHHEMKEKPLSNP